MKEKKIIIKLEKDFDTNELLNIKRQAEFLSIAIGQVIEIQTKKAK